MFKRCFDLLFSLLGLALLFPFLLVIVALVKLDSAGPAFYIQERIGKHGSVFRLVKFRTMHINADRLAAITVGARDRRITRAGFYLRKFKLDELPQLINVLVGDMSFVGPRPELKKFVDLYSEDQRRVLLVRPGITDPASIKFRHENELLEGREDPIRYYVDVIMPQKLAMNLDYIRRQSIASDLKVMLSTAFSIFKREK
jgi:lipopolysaccharide/colanic/teichoic acid biosynthesis glycosyltransferase